MPSFEREQPSDRHLRHQHSASSANALIPMWDSSDPIRAPPPLPLNPVSPTPGASPSRSGTSLAIQNAHAALTAKAQENAVGPVIHKRSTDLSPERGFPTGRSSPHRRMQSLQPGSVRDLSLMIEAGRDPANTTPKVSSEKDRFPRPATPVRHRDPEKEPKSIEKDQTITGPISIASNMTPTMRSGPRWPQHSILGENTPPQSATMIALQNMATPPAREIESPLASVTNNAAPQPTKISTSASHEHLSNQLVILTNIATALQREMTALSRRSRDNATDLMSLKEATHARDEDIRKSLRELASNVDPKKHHRDPYNNGLYLENKAFDGSNPRPFALPRVPSPSSFAASLDMESVLSTPSLVGSETPATMALLEKIIREMSTKDGLDMMLDRLSELAERLSGMASGAKVEELLDQVRSMRQQQAMIPLPNKQQTGPRSLSFNSASEDSVRGLDWDRHNTQKTGELILDVARRPSSDPGRHTDVLNDEIIGIIHSVKDSVAQGGGLTAEVKALVRELRGEVLGMGRELGRKLEETGSKSSNSMGDPNDKSETASKAELARVVEEGLEEMKVYMQQRLREHRRESTQSDKSVIDYQEIYNAMRTAISDAQANKPQDSQLSRDDVLNAVKDAWENYKPEIEIQQVGLERDDLLACIKEGLQEYAPQHGVPSAVMREEVVTAVVEGMKHFEPPKIDTPESLSRDEILDAVRECLEEFEFPVAPSAMVNDLTREDMLHAVKQGLGEFGFPNSSKALVAPDGGNPNIIEKLHDVMQFMQNEFKAMSEQAQQHVVVNERDTEQVLDATKQGFETLRVHIEEYVDRVSDNTSVEGQEELMSNLVNSFDSFRDELSEMISKTWDSSRDLVKQEIESLRDAVNSSLVPHVPPPVDNREALEAIREGLDRVRTDLMRPHAGTTDILDALHEGFGEIRSCVEKINDKPVDLTANDEILEALKSGLDDVRADIDTLRGSSDNDKAIVTIGREPMNALVPTDLVKHDDIKNLEVIMADLQIKMSAMDIARPPGAPLPEGGVSKEDLAEMEEILRNGVSKEDLHEMEERLQNGLSKEDLEEMEKRLLSGLSKEDLNDMEQRLQNGVSKEDLNEMEAMLRKGVSKEDLTEMEHMLRHMQKSMAVISKMPLGDNGEPLFPPANPEDAATKEDVLAIETILRNTKSRLDDLIDGEQAVRKDHVDAVEALLIKAQDSVTSLAAQLEAVSRKEDLTPIESLVTQIMAAFVEMKERTEQDPERVTKSHVEEIGATILGIKTLVEKVSENDIAALPSKDDLNKIEEVVREIKDYNINDLPSKDDLKAVEDVVRSINEHSTSILPSKDDLKIVEDVVREIKDLNTVLPSREELKTVEDLVRDVKDHSTALASKEDLQILENMVKEIKDYHAAQEEANSIALASRQVEVGSVNDRVADVRTFLQEFQSVVNDKLESGGTGVEAVGRMLEGLGETINQNASVGSDLKKMFELMKSEFEESKATGVGAKLDTDEKLKEAADLLHAKFEIKIGELLTKYEEFQLVINDRAKAGEVRDVQLEAAVVGNKAVAEELKLLIDTLGSTVTDSLEKMEEASKTVFERVEVLYNKAETNHAEGKTEHEMTREQVKQAIGVVEGLQGHVSNYQPKILEAVKDVLLLVGEHYEHTKAVPPVEKYSDAEVQSKLDRLVDHSHAADKAYTQLDALDKVHQQVVQTAADINDFLSSQKQQIKSEYEDREKALLENTIALERQKVEQEHITAHVATLRDEESQLRESILALRTEQEFLARQKTRLTADVSSLETALHLRREELHAMDVRAEGLERRILEGVLDHSRALLMTSKSGGGREAMSRKRVARSSLGVDDGGDGTRRKPRSGVDMAVNGGRVSLATPNGTSAATAANRRILSLSQINNNVPTGGLSRSHSVRTPAAGSGQPRKSSWAPADAASAAPTTALTTTRGNKGYGDLDKENVSMREMDDEYDDEGDDERDIYDAAAAASTVGIPTPVDEEADPSDDNSDPEDTDDAASGTLRRPSSAAAGNYTTDDEEVDSRDSSLLTDGSGALSTRVIT